MRPHSNFLIAAPIRTGHEGDFRALLGTMNRLPGFADPANRLVPFGRFDAVHFARFVILKDETAADLQAYGSSFPHAPVYLAFLVDCDGSADACLTEFATRASDGLRAL